jgi:hypothetical protein
VRLALLGLLLASAPGFAQVTCPVGANTWTGSGGNTDWFTAGNWSLGTPVDGQNICFNSAATPNLSASFIANSLTFLGSANVTITSDPFVTLEVDAGGISRATGGSFNIAPEVLFLGASQPWVFEAGGTSLFTAPLAGLAGTEVVTKTGGGLATLSGASSGFGGIDWTGSTLSVTSDNGLGSGTPVTLRGANSALLLTSGSALNLGNDVTALVGSTATSIVGVATSVAGTRHALGTLTVANGATVNQTTSGATQASLQLGGLTLAGTGTLLKTNNTGGLFIAGPVSDSASSTINLHIGITAPTSAQLDQGLHFTSSTTVASLISSTFANQSAMIGADGATTLTLTGPVDVAGVGRLILIPRTGGTIRFGPSSFNAPGNVNDIQLRGDSTGAVEFTNSAVTGQGVSVFDGVALQTDTDPPPPRVTFSTTNGATWRVRNAAQTLSGSLTMNASGTVDTGVDLTITGTLAGSGALTKVGSANLVLGPGTHTHSGGITANAGTVVVNGTAAGEGTVSINNGAGVAGAGTLQSSTGPITVAGGARYTPGSGGSGTLTTNDLSFSDTSILNFNIGGPNTNGVVNGALILDGILNLTAGAGLAAGQQFTLFTASGGVTDNGLRTQVGSLPAGFSFDYLASGTTVVLKVGPGATAVEMASFDAVSDGKATRISWESGTEVRNLGYRVHREENGRRTEVSGLIAGSVLRAGYDPLAGRNYAFTDPSGRYGGRYWIEAIDLKGQSQWFGPVDVRRGAVPPTGRGSAALVAQLGTSPMLMATGSNARQADPLGYRRLSPSRDLRQQWAVASSTRAVKLLVRQDGVYRVSSDQLVAAGFAPGTPLSSVQLWAGGRPVAFRVVGGSIEFFGQATDTRYTDTRVYWVTTGLGQPVRIANAPATSAAATASSFPETLEIRDRTLHILGLINASTDSFFGPPLTGTKPLERIFSTPALAVLANDPAVLEVSIQGLTDGAHTLDVTVNGLPVGTIQSVFQDVATVRFTLPPGALLPGDNRIAIAGRTTAEFAVEISQRLTYQRLYSLSGPLRFTAPSGSQLLLGGADRSTQVLDITSPFAPAAVATSGTSGGLQLTASGSGNRVLYAYREQDVLAPAVVANNPSAWHDYGGADLVIIGKAELLPSLRPLAEQRAREGLTVATIDIEDVYDEFSAGEKDALAIRSFLSSASERWTTAPSWVLLAGAATYDPRGWLGQPELDQVPTMYVTTKTMETASDDALVTFDSSGPALAVGRLPVSTPADMNLLVAKILGRRLATSQDTLLFARDRDGITSFSAASAEVQGAFSSWKTQTFVRGADDTANHSALLDALRAGPVAVDYQGHGAEDFWNGRVLSTSDVDVLGGSGSASLVVAATCLNAYFVDIGRETLGSALLRVPGGGAWGVWASSALTLPTDHPLLSKTLLTAALNQGLTLGEATLQAKRAVSDRDVRATFHLLGDPSARAVATRASALTLGTPKSTASGCSTPGGPLSVLAPLVLGALALSLRRRRFG